jgi:hypothetical protein
MRFDGLTPYPIRIYTYRKDQVNVDEVQRVIVYSSKEAP